MKKLAFMVAVALGFACCVPMDVPEISIEGGSSLFTVSHEGGELIIPVNSTGVDDVRITYPNGDDWQFDPETGDMIPVEGWVQVVKVIKNYDTRDLPVWRSGIQLQVAVNDSGKERLAKVRITSFNKSTTATIRQGF